jgi:hypothetical protein
MSALSKQDAFSAPVNATTFYEKINREWHKPALQLFMFVVLAHWAEHLAQAFQVYVLNWSIPEARGVLGVWLPWLIKSELLHYLYAVVMLVGIWSLRKGFQGRAHKWWMIAFGIQFWHHTAPFLQHHSFHPDGRGNVLPHVPAPGRNDGARMFLRLAEIGGRVFRLNPNGQ